MEGKKELLELLREIIREAQVDAMASDQGAQIVIHHLTLILGADMGTMTAVKMLVQAFRSSRRAPPQRAAAEQSSTTQVV